MGEKGKVSASINPPYTTKGITGDSVKPFGKNEDRRKGREAADMSLSPEAAAKRLKDELEGVLSEIVSAEDYLWTIFGQTTGARHILKRSSTHTGG